VLRPATANSRICQDQAFIKRIIAKPGQIVSIANGKVYLNSEPLQEEYIAEPPAYQWGPQRVPDEEFFFVMGTTGRQQ